MWNSWSLHPNTYLLIDKLLKPGQTILELGSGESTRILSEKYNVISIEHDEKYIGVHKSHYIYAPLKPIKPTAEFPFCAEWYDSDVIKREVPNLKYDLMIIDGPIAGTRCGLRKYHDLFNFDVPVIMDDSQRDYVWKLLVIVSRPYAKESNILTFRCFEPNNRKMYSLWVPDRLKGCLRDLL